MVRIRLRTDGLRPPGGEAAFTLLEVLVVCLLLAIIAAVAIPVIRDSLLTDRLKATGRTIIGTVRQLRTEAVRSRRPETLVFDLDQGRFWVVREGGRQYGTKPSVRHSVTLPSNVRIVDIWTKACGRRSRGIIDLRISGQGYMDTTVIHLADRHRTLSLFFSAFLGSIKVVDGYASL